MFRSSSLLRTILGAGLILAAPGLASQEAPPQSAMRALAEEACQPNPEHGIPPKARAILERLKDQLGPWLLECLKAQGERATPQIAERLGNDLEALASGTPNPEDSFWHPLDFQVEAPTTHPELLTVKATFGIDATLLVFQRREGGWTLRFQDRAPVSQDIDGLFGDYAVELHPIGADGSFLLSATRITPWYQSNWREAELRVFRLPPVGSAKRIGSWKGPVFLGVDSPLETTVEDATHLLLQVQSGSSDASRHSFRRTIHLALGPSGLKRVPPFADTPVDLVDEWLGLPWPEAASLVEPSARTRLKQLHKRLSEHDANVLTFAEEVRHSDDSEVWEVEAELERDERTETYTFHLGRNPAGFRLLDIQRRDP